MYIAWTEKIVAILLLVNALETLALRAWWEGTGIYRWADFRAEFETDFAKKFLDYFFGEREFRRLLIFQILCAGLWFLVSVLQIEGYASLVLLNLLLHWLVGLRFGGTVNGGSDYLLAVLLLGLLGHRSGLLLFQKLGVYYVLVQLTYSYFVAGLSKLIQPEWRQGLALQRFLRFQSFPVSGFRWIQRGVRWQPVALLVSGLVIAFELGFPLIWLLDSSFLIKATEGGLGSLTLKSSVLAGVLICGGLFHLGNAILFGLNRFFWAWLAAYGFVLDHFL